MIPPFSSALNELHDCATVETRVRNLKNSLTSSSIFIFHSENNTKARTRWVSHRTRMNYDCRNSIFNIFVCKMWLVTAWLFFLHKALQINKVFVKKQKTMKQLVLKAVSRCNFNPESSTNSGLMTAPRRPAWHLNLLEAERTNNMHQQRSSRDGK